MERIRWILSDPWHLWLALFLAGLFACAAGTWLACALFRINPRHHDDDQAN